MELMFYKSIATTMIRSSQRINERIMVKVSMPNSVMSQVTYGHIYALHAKRSKQAFAVCSL